MSSTLTLRLHVGDVLHVLHVMEAAYDDASDLMADVLLTMIRSTQLNFEAQGRPVRWADLAESTERRRFAKAMGGRGARTLGSLGTLGSLLILQVTGSLFQSLGGGASGPFEAKDGFGESDRFTATIGTNRPGWQNQFADTRGWREARPMVEFQNQDVEDIGAMAADWALRTGSYAVA